jgi:endo-1,3(4)-beta-glucanase
MSISHIEASQRVYGPTGSNGAAAYYLNPIGIQSMVISAQELGSDTNLTTDQLTAFSARVSLRANVSATAAVQFPFVQGNAFITAQFNGATPLIQSGVFYRTVTRATKEPKTGITKYKFTLEDGTIWLLYAYHTSGSALNLQVVNNGLARATGPFYGIIQVAKDPGSGETFYDQACGAYPTGVQLSGNVAGVKGTYTFTYTKAGMSNTKLAMMALPHHIQSFDDATRAGVNSTFTLQTTTKGLATAVVADSWTMVEPKLPVNMAFAPWSSNRGSMTTLSSSIKATILKTAKQEISQDIMAQTNQNSMYYAGKALAKFAAIIYTLNDLLGQTALAATALGELKKAFAQFASNQQQYPLLYESAWGGVVSSASYVTGNSGADFGNSYYNDHHFHYGYFIYAAAVIGYLDPTWVKANKDYVNMLVRDISNPSDQDPYFPVQRMFDWYNGHSWAHGLFESLDGKDQESSSEDVMHAYAIKMWGQTVGDSSMVAR